MSSKFETLLNTKKCPWLIYIHGTGNRPKQTLFSLTEARYYETTLPITRNMCTFACSYGWILMLGNDSDDCFLFNPISMVKIKLPNFGTGYTMYSCNLSHSPDNPNCIVLTFCSNPQPCIRFCKPSDTEWTYQVLDCKDKLVSVLAPINGKFYGLYEGTTMMMMLEYNGFSINMRFDNEDEAIMVPGFLMRGMRDYRERHLVESCGELFIVDIAFFGLIRDKIRYIQVNKFDTNKLTWEKIENLGDRAFFINNDKFGQSCLASEYGAKENCIYCILKEEKKLHIFDMEDLTITTIVTCSERFKNWSSTLWVFPP